MSRKAKVAASSVSPEVIAQAIALIQAGNTPQVAESSAKMQAVEGVSATHAKISANAYVVTYRGYKGLLIFGAKRKNGERSWKFFGKARVQGVVENLDAFKQAAELLAK